MRHAITLMAVALMMSGCAAFRQGATPEEREAAAGTVETVTTALGDALPWPWNQIVFALGVGGSAYLLGRRGVRVGVTTAPPKP